MSKAITLAAIVVAAAATTGCSSFSHAVGAAKASPDEFRVVTAAPLTLPPDYALRPPRPGEPRPQELAPDAEAHAALFGQDVAPNASPGERALVGAAGADAVDPNIRDQLDFEGQSIVHRSQGFADRVLNFHGSASPATQTPAPLDPAAEQARLADEEAVRRATGGGHVIIERSGHGFKLPGT